MTKRTVTIGYRYPLTYVARGGRTAKTALINSSFEAEVTWLSEKDAPIALVIQEQAAKDILRPHERRAFEGRCYHSPFFFEQPDGVTAEEALRRPQTTSKLLDGLVPITIKGWCSDSNADTAFDHYPMEVARVISDRKEEAESVIRKGFEKIAVIGDRLHVRRRQPMAGVQLATLKSGSRKLTGDTRIEMYNTGNRAGGLFQFRPERLEEARRFTRAWATGEVRDFLKIASVERDTDLLLPESEAIINTEVAADRALKLLSNFIGHLPDDGYQLLARVGRAHNLAVNDDPSSIPLLTSAFDDLEAANCFADDMFWARSEMEFWLPILRDAVTNSIDYPELAFGRSDDPDLAVLTP